MHLLLFDREKALGKKYAELATCPPNKYIYLHAKDRSVYDFESLH
jgi:hypothetical protein